MKYVPQDLEGTYSLIIAVQRRN